MSVLGCVADGDEAALEGEVFGAAVRWCFRDEMPVTPELSPSTSSSVFGQVLQLDLAGGHLVH